MRSPEKPTTRTTFYDHLDDPWFKNQFTESTGVTVKPIPGYLKRQGFPPEELDSDAKQRRTKRMMEMSFDPPNHKRGPKAFGSLPVPVVYLPVSTVKKQQDWNIPPCNSNWENPDGDLVPLETRIAASRRHLYDYQSLAINKNFRKVSETLHAAAGRVRETVSMRSEMQKEKERKEQELKDRAQNVGDARGDYEYEYGCESEREETEEDIQREEIREEQDQF